MSEPLLTQIRPEVRALLGRLRGRIRRYVLLEGFALIVALLGLLFWVSFGLDWAYFQVSHLELPIWFRATVQWGTLLGIPLFALWLGVPLLRSFRSKALALVLEKRFPELDDRLITAVETAENGAGQTTPLTAAMLAKTVDDVSRAAQSLRVDEVFRKTPLRRVLSMAVTLVLSIAAFYAVNQEAMARWSKAYLQLEDRYWNRDTHLTVKVMAEPGEIVREFKDYTYKHPRGGDLTLLIDVPEKKPDGTPWVVPDRVEVRYRLAEGRGSDRVTCIQTGDRQFKYSVGKLLDGMEFHVVGGDFTNRRPYRIIVVDPPQISRIVLDSNFPAYTDRNPTDADGNPQRTDVAVQGTQVSIPVETHFLMRAAVNKKLVNVRIQYGQYELSFGDFPARAVSGTAPSAVTTGEAVATGETEFRAELKRRSQDGQTEQTLPIDLEAARQFLAGDRKSFAVPFVLSAAATQAARKRIADSADPTFGAPFLMPPDSRVRIYLEDADGILSSEPARLTIEGIEDHAPIVDVNLKGIGRSITRRAAIPMTGLLSDDYGLVAAKFNFRVDGEDKWRIRPLGNPPSGRPLDFKLQRERDQEFERFDVLPMDLEVGQKLRLTVYAEDGDNLNGPHSARGEVFVFTIVSSEELLSQLYIKELNLRRRFEQIIKEITDARKDLVLHRARAEKAKSLKAAGPSAGKESDFQAQLNDIRIAVVTSAERTLHQIGKNHNEAQAIENDFRELLEELVNNAVHTPKMVDRIRALIVKPMHGINEEDFPACDRAVGLFRLANEKGNDPTPRIDDAVADIDTMLIHMQAVLKEMQDLVKFHEAIRNLKKIIDDERDVQESTKKRRDADTIKKLKGLTP